MGYYIPLSHMVLDAALNEGTSDNVYSFNRSSRFNLFIALKKIHTQIYPFSPVDLIIPPPGTSSCGSATWC